MPGRFSGRKVMLGFILLIVVVGAMGAIRFLRSPHRPANVVADAWSVVNTYNYDRTFNGYDWPAVRRHFIARAPLLDPHREKTESLVGEMLALLGSSHVQYIPPEEAALADSRPRAGILLPELRDIAGMTVTGFGSTKVPQALEVTSGSLAEHAGVRVGDHVLVSVESPSHGGDRVRFDVSTRDGEARELVAVRQGAGKAGSVRFEPVSNQIIIDRFDGESMRHIVALLAEHRAPTLTLRFVDLGLVSSRLKTGSMPRVVDVAPQSAAEKAGVEPGAQLMEVHTEPKDPAAPDRVIQDLSVEQPDGTRVSFQGQGDRSKLKAWGAARQAQVIDGVLVLQFNEFSEESQRWVHEQLAQNLGKPVVLDLRNNIGGLAASMEIFLADFLPPDALIATQQAADGRSALQVPASAHPSTTKLAVLIGPVTASAAEVTAAALRHHKRATLIGWPTAGEVVVARTYGLKNGGRIQVPFASLVDAAGQELEGYGVTPDITAWNTLADIRAGRDMPLACALKTVNGQSCQ